MRGCVEGAPRRGAVIPRSAAGAAGIAREIGGWGGFRTHELGVWDMKLEQFSALVDAYGSRPEHWPRALRGEAGRLLGSSPQAAALLARAERLDRLVVDWATGTEAEIGDAEVERVVDAVMARLPAQAGLSAATGASPGALSSRRWLGVIEWGLASLSIGREWAPRFALSLVVAVGLGLVVGSVVADRTQASYTSVQMLTMARSSYSPLDPR